MINFTFNFHKPSQKVSRRDKLNNEFTAQYLEFLDTLEELPISTAEASQLLKLMDACIQRAREEERMNK